MTDSSQQSSSGTGIDARLIGLCVVLWIVAGAILWQNWPDTKRDYYWGNIMQGLEGQPPRLDQESVNALAAMGDAIIPSCSYELTHHWNPAFRVAVLKVLEGSKAESSRGLLEWAATHDLDARVRANALLSLRLRAKATPAEMAPLSKLAEEVAFGKQSGDPDLNVRATAALALAEGGDKRPQVEALLVYALRGPLLGNPFISRDAAAALAKANPDAPAVKFDVNAREYLNQIVACEKWAQSHDIALVASAIVIPVTSGSGDGK